MHEDHSGTKQDLVVAGRWTADTHTHTKKNLFDLLLNVTNMTSVCMRTSLHEYAEGFDSAFLFYAKLEERVERSCWLV